jgi:hypothetical protein
MGRALHPFSIVPEIFEQRDYENSLAKNLIVIFRFHLTFDEVTFRVEKFPARCQPDADNIPIDRISFEKQVKIVVVDVSRWPPVTKKSIVPRRYKTVTAPRPNNATKIYPFSGALSAPYNTSHRLGLHNAGGGPSINTGWLAHSPSRVIDNVRLH